MQSNSTGINMKGIKQIIVTKIKWDASASIKLPKKVIIDITKGNRHLLDDIDTYADGVSEYLSDKYGYCTYEFQTQCK